MKLKTIEVEGKTYAEVQDGKPIFVHDDGKESPFDAAASVAAIAARNAEARQHREAKEAAVASLKAYEGLDADAARKALEITSKLDAKALVDAGKVDEVRAEAERVWAERVRTTEDKYKPQVSKLEKERDTLKQALDREVIGGSFSRSKFIAEKLAVPREMVESYFGQHFAIENGRLSAKGPDGNPIYSRSNPGVPAEFDEALEFLVITSPFRDSVLKGTGASGSGAAQTPAAPTGSKTMPRATFTALTAAEQMAHVKAGGVVTD